MSRHPPYTSCAAKAAAMLTLLLCVWSVSTPALAADRMRPGQWVGSTTAGTRTIPNSSCISRSDADAMNGDAQSVRAFLQQSIPPEICKLSDFKVNGAEIVYTATCGNAASKVITASHHGDRSEG